MFLLDKAKLRRYPNYDISNDLSQPLLRAKKSSNKLLSSNKCFL